MCLSKVTVYPSVNEIIKYRIQYLQWELKMVSLLKKLKAGMTACPFPVTLTISSSLSRTCTLMNTSGLEVCTCTVAICDALTFTEYLKRKKKNIAI